MSRTGQHAQLTHMLISLKPAHGSRWTLVRCSSTFLLLGERVMSCVAASILASNMNNIATLFTIWAFSAYVLSAPVVDVEECSASGNTQYCCDGTLNCLPVVVGSSCENDAYCCEGGPSVRTSPLACPVFLRLGLTFYTTGGIDQCRRGELRQDTLNVL